MLRYKIQFFVILLMFFVLGGSCQASSLSDKDGDAVPDYDEINSYYTDPNNSDTDGDGYSDWTELNNGFSPHNPERVKLEDCDTDSDGLSDRMELNFHTNLIKMDTDGDGYGDGDEIKNGYDPLNSGAKKLLKQIKVDLKNQNLSYFLGGVQLGAFKVSTGKWSMPTPTGHFAIYNKFERAWSRAYGLWMPYWMGMSYGKFGIHELPEWPDGTKEGEDHLGTPVSHGCIRLGVGSAETIYDFAEVGTDVEIF